MRANLSGIAIPSTASSSTPSPAPKYEPYAQERSTPPCATSRLLRPPALWRRLDNSGCDAKRPQASRIRYGAALLNALARGEEQQHRTSDPSRHRHRRQGSHPVLLVRHLAAESRNPAEISGEDPDGRGDVRTQCRNTDGEEHRERNERSATCDAVDHPRAEAGHCDERVTPRPGDG